MKRPFSNKTRRINIICLDHPIVTCEVLKETACHSLNTAIIMRGEESHSFFPLSAVRLVCK